MVCWLLENINFGIYPGRLNAQTHARPNLKILTCAHTQHLNPHTKDTFIVTNGSVSNAFQSSFPGSDFIYNERQRTLAQGRQAFMFVTGMEA